MCYKGFIWSKHNKNHHHHHHHHHQKSSSSSLSVQSSLSSRCLLDFVGSFFCYLRSRSTILVQFKSDKNAELQYKAGDHVAIFPANRPEFVQALIDRLSDEIDPDSPIVVEALREVKGN